MTIETAPTRLLPAVDLAGVETRLRQLYAIGAQPEGGSTRLVFTPEERAARELATAWMEAIGLQVRRDAAGNLLGLPPDAGSEPPVLSGSHLDTVPSGGMFDGALGVVGAIEAVRLARASGVSTRSPLGVIVFANEEGSRFGNGLSGSRALAGALHPAELELRDAAGVSFAEAMRADGLDPDRLGEAVLPPGCLRAFVELHIEQASTLERAGATIGVVTDIAAPQHSWLRLRGAAAHAGTTPMPARHDALLGAAEVALAVERIARRRASPYTVATVGRIEVRPGGINVVPGEARLTLDLRDRSALEREQAYARILRSARRIARRRGLALEHGITLSVPPVALSPRVVRTITGVCGALGIPHLPVVSGAGHDAMVLAGLTDAGMIFVPSRDGLSHAPGEWSEWADIERGIAVLAHTLLALAA